VAGFGSADAVFLSVLVPCFAFALEVPVSVPGSCFDGVLGTLVSVQESCSSSALEAAVCVPVASFDICSEFVEVAFALLVGGFESV
jgi:hypothetical protein